MRVFLLTPGTIQTRESLMCKGILFVLAIVIIFAATVFASSGWVIYHESAFKGKVIDAETKEPIEGAVVVAIYRIREYSFVESGAAVADVKEVLTDKNGEFNIPPHTFFSFYPVAKGEAPEFIIYKPGYTSFPSFDYPKYFPSSPLYVDLQTRADFFRKGVTVELMKLKTREEMEDARRSADIFSLEITAKELPLLYKIIEEDKLRGK